MPDDKVQVDRQPPTERVPAESLSTIGVASVTATAPDGRVFTLKEPGPMAPLDLVEGLGEVSGTYLQMVAPLLYLSDIDGEPVHIPASKIELRALMQQLGNPGFAFLADQIQEHFIPAEAWPDDTAAQRAKKAKKLAEFAAAGLTKQQAAIKN